MKETALGSRLFPVVVVVVGIPVTRIKIILFCKVMSRE